MVATGLSGFFRVSWFREKMIAPMTATTMATTRKAVRTARIRFGRLESPASEPDDRPVLVAVGIHPHGDVLASDVDLVEHAHLGSGVVLVGAGPPCGLRGLVRFLEQINGGDRQVELGLDLLKRPGEGQGRGVAGVRVLVHRHRQHAVQRRWGVLAAQRRQGVLDDAAGELVDIRDASVSKGLRPVSMAKVVAPRE